MLIERGFKSFDALAKHQRLISTNQTHTTKRQLCISLANDIERVKLLVKHGARLNNLGWSPIHYAAIKGNDEIVKYLLDHGAWPNSPAPDGSNPLMMSVSVGNLNAVKALMDAGADPNAVNFDGVSAMEIAKKKGNRRLLELLGQ